MTERIEPVIPEQIRKAMKIVTDEGYRPSDRPIALWQFFPDEAGVGASHGYAKNEENGTRQYISFVCVASDETVAADLGDPQNWLIVEVKVHQSELIDFESLSTRPMAAIISIEEFFTKKPAQSVSTFFREVEARQRAKSLGSTDLALSLG